MAQQVEGWPLGLEPLNERIGLARNRSNSRSMSFNMLFSGSPSSITDSSSNFDTEIKIPARLSYQNTNANDLVPVSVANADTRHVT
ncbi:hypothetical protein RIF29_32046 [Crotalaria pallida]|uniref:Uncharacterized protein n=1 Tax=Crotalaria pallida TaxID=3830 RepID=A0AAN9EHQ5_CROPI